MLKAAVLILVDLIGIMKFIKHNVNDILIHNVNDILIYNLLYTIGLSTKLPSPSPKTDPELPSPSPKTDPQLPTPTEKTDPQIPTKSKKIDPRITPKREPTPNFTDSVAEKPTPFFYRLGKNRPGTELI